MSELKPCPFCGGEAELVWNVIGGFVGCFNEECPVGPSTGTFAVGDEWKSEAEAEPHIIDAWNTRAERTCRLITAENVEGFEWPMPGRVECSACGAEWFPENDKSRFNYCPNCGAKVTEKVVRK